MAGDDGYEFGTRVRWSAGADFFELVGPPDAEGGRPFYSVKADHNGQGVLVQVVLGEATDSLVASMGFAAFAREFTAWVMMPPARQR